MRERVAAAAVVLLVLFGAGVLIDQLWLSSPAPAPVAVEREPVSTPDSSLASTSASNLGPRESDGVVTRIGGTLLRSSAGAGPRPARVGDVVPAGSSLRTEGGSATIDFSSASVELFDRSEVQLEADADAWRQLRLRSGRARVDAPSGADRLRLRFADSDAVAEVDGAELTALTDGRGRVAVTTDRGVVRLSARGETVEVREGEQSDVQPDRAPSSPRRVPGSFYLRVRRPPAETRSRVVSVAGEVSPGSLVTVNGQPASVDASGRFRARVALREGSNHATIEAQDVRGRSERARHRIEVDSHASAIESDVAW